MLAIKGTLSFTVIPLVFKKVVCAYIHTNAKASVIDDLEELVDCRDMVIFGELTLINQNGEKEKLQAEETLYLSLQKEISFK